MILSIETGALSRRFGDKKAIKIFKEAGFDAFDLSFCSRSEAEKALESDNFMDYIKDLKAYTDSLGFFCNQAHAPFASKKDGEVYEKIVRSIEAAAYMGAKIIVVHPLVNVERNHFCDYEDDFCENMEFYKGLIPVAEKFGIKIAIENMYITDERRGVKVSCICSHADEFNRYIDGIDSEYIVGCLDTGHTVLVSDNPADMIMKMGSRVCALHVHDVDCINDNHTLPYLCKINWDEFCAALAKVGYKGDFTFEVGSFFSSYMDDDFIPIAAKFAQQVGKSLIKKIENQAK